MIPEQIFLKPFCVMDTLVVNICFVDCPEHTPPPLLPLPTFLRNMFLPSSPRVRTRGYRSRTLGGHVHISCSHPLDPNH